MDHRLAKPSSLTFIAGSIFLGLILNIFPWGNHTWVPDWLLIVLVFWNIYEPRRVGITIAFFLGLLMDVQSSSVLGLHSMTYATVAYITTAWHRRILDLSTIAQAFHLLPIFLIASLFNYLVLIWVHNGPELNGLWIFVPTLLEALLWPSAKWLLTYPLRRQNPNLPL